MADNNNKVELNDLIQAIKYISDKMYYKGKRKDLKDLVRQLPDSKEKKKLLRLLTFSITEGRIKDIINDMHARTVKESGPKPKKPYPKSKPAQIIRSGYKVPGPRRVSAEGNLPEDQSLDGRE